MPINDFEEQLGNNKPYEYGRKTSVVSTFKSQVIVGIASHDKHVHDSEALKAALANADSHRQTTIDLAVVDRGYRDAKKKVDDRFFVSNTRGWMGIKPTHRGKKSPQVMWIPLGHIDHTER